MDFWTPLLFLESSAFKETSKTSHQAALWSARVRDRQPRTIPTKDLPHQVVFWGNGRSTASRVLFKGEKDSLNLTEFYGKLVEFCEKLGEFALAHKF